MHNVQIVYGLDKLQETIDNIENDVIVLYADKVPRLMTFLPLYNEIIDNDYHPIFIIDITIKIEDSDFTSLCPKKIFQLEGSKLHYLENVKLFFAPESIKNLPPIGANTVGIVHSLPDSHGLVFQLSGLIKNRPTLLQNFDYIIIPTYEYGQTEGVLRFCDKIFPENLLKDRSETIKIVRGGYPKVDYLKKYISDENNEKDCIIYAPTISRLKYSEIKKYGESVIETILSNIEDEFLVFRPYPHDYEAIELVSKFREYENFIIDTSLTGLNYQKRAKFIVTDRSSFAVTHALATKTPVIFCNFDSFFVKNNLSLNEQSELIKWDKLGFRVGDLDSLKIALFRCLYRREEYRSRITEFASNYLANYNNSCKYIISQIHNFISGKSDKEYIEFYRRSCDSLNNEFDSTSHIEYLKNLWPANNLFQKKALEDIESNFH